MKKLFTWLLNPPDSGPKATILIRLMAGGVFLWEGGILEPRDGVAQSSDDR